MVRNIGGIPVKEKENWIFENNRYTPKGFLLKNFPLSTVVFIRKNLFFFNLFKILFLQITEGIKPTLTELQRFEESPEGVDSESNFDSIKFYFQFKSYFLINNY